MGQKNSLFKAVPARLWAMTRVLLASAVELMREQAIFEVPDLDNDKYAARPLEESGRERQWELATLQLFRRRTVLITIVSMISLPFFWAIFSHFAPAACWQIGAAHLLMFLNCLTLNLVARRANRLVLLRLISMGAYFVYGITASVVMWLASELRVTAFSGHQHILLSMLFVPFSWPETILCGLVVAGTYSISLALSLPAELQFTLMGHIFSMFFLASLVVILNELQNKARRRAFDISFDMAATANRGAALSTLDEVTGGYNRRHLSNMTELELARMQRFRQPLGVIMFDLDNFKRVNDTNGHVAGDAVLRQIFTSARATLRNIDTIARYGGDEFVILMPHADQEAICEAAHRVRLEVLQELQTHFPCGSLESLVTLSLGAISIACESNFSVEDVIACADAQLYEAKRAGKDRVCAAVD